MAIKAADANMASGADELDEAYMANKTSLADKAVAAVNSTIMCFAVVVVSPFPNLEMQHNNKERHNLVRESSHLKVAKGIC